MSLDAVGKRVSVLAGIIFKMTSCFQQCLSVVLTISLNIMAEITDILN